MIRSLIEDAVELARAGHGSTTPRSVARAVLLNESFRITAVQRLRQLASAAHVPGANHLLRYVQTVVWGLEIDRTVTLGRGVFIVHPFGIVIGGTSRIGDRVRFYGNNTVGTIRDDGYPVIEDDVWVGAGARILGPIRIGAGARIGANAVVLTDVPPRHVAVGVPARILPPREGRTHDGVPGRAVSGARP